MSYRSSNSRSSVPRPPSFGSGNGGAPRKPSVSSSPVCVHCRNLGLEYAHWLRKSPEPDSPVVCPVLLATECRYCHELGHTVAGCPAKKRNVPLSYNGKPSPLIARTPIATVVAPALPARTNNAYSAFDNDSSTDSGSDTDTSYQSGILQFTYETPNVVSPRILQSNIGKKRVVVSSLFAHSSSKKATVVCPAKAKQVDVGSLFSPVPVAIVVSRLCAQPEVGEDELHEYEYDWTTYGDPDVDRMITDIRARFSSGKSWADICYDDCE